MVKISTKTASDYDPPIPKYLLGVCGVAGRRGVCEYVGMGKCANIRKRYSL